MINNKEMNVCLLLGGEDLQEKFSREIETLLNETNAKVPLILIDEDSKQSDDNLKEFSGIRFSYVPSFFRMLKRKGPRVLIWGEAYLTALLTRSETPYEQLRSLRTSTTHIDSIGELSDAKRCYFTSEQVGDYTYTIPDQVVDKVIAETDVVVLLGFNKILRGRILTEPTHGTLSLHWSDIRRYRGRPGCFWQFLNNEDTIGLTLQRLTEELDGGDIVVCRHTDISDAQTWFDVRLRATQMYGSMVAEGIRNLQDPKFEVDVLSEDELGRMTYESDGYKMKNVLRMIGKNVLGRLLR